MHLIFLTVWKPPGRASEKTVTSWLAAKRSTHDISTLGQGWNEFLAKHKSDNIERLQVILGRWGMTLTYV